MNNRPLLHNMSAPSLIGQNLKYSTVRSISVLAVYLVNSPRNSWATKVVYVPKIREEKRNHETHASIISSQCCVSRCFTSASGISIPVVSFKNLFWSLSLWTINTTRRHLSKGEFRPSKAASLSTYALSLDATVLVMFNYVIVSKLWVFDGLSQQLPVAWLAWPHLATVSVKSWFHPWLYSGGFSIVVESS